MKPIGNSVLISFLILLISLSSYAQNNIYSANRSVFDDPEPLNIESLKRIKQEMVAPPALPKHSQIAAAEPVIVEAELIVDEKKIQIALDATLWAMTFNGTVPGPAIVAHEGDYVEITLTNPATNALKHNVDFHAVTGAMGGGDMTFVSPGEHAVIRFRATKPGVFYYHCAPGGMMNPSHIVAGMNGMIMILPRDGLKDEHGNSIEYDKAYYITEQDYYIPKDENDAYKDYDNIRQTFGDYRDAMMTLKPTHVVFNGAVGALSGENALTANVGEKVLFITVAANIDTRLHIVGGHADLVWLGGSFSNKPVTNYETWPVVAGSAAAAIYKFRQPGMYVLINHNMIIGNGMGANADIMVEGEWNNDILQQVVETEPIPK